MYVNNGDDVLQVYQRGVMLLSGSGADVENSRAGEVRVWPTPVVTVTKHPERCVLLDRERRANPFFHAYEALWMLCGHRDARMLDTFVSDFSERFAEEDGAQWGAYGHRWRKHFGTDQVLHAVKLLRANNADRRVVISMWDPKHDLGADVKDVPCNTHIYPRITGGFLSLTICCRSNDAVWGAHGANAVHFSFLQQYMARAVGVRVGPMYQLSNNYHIYTERAKQLDPNPPAADWDKIVPLVQDPVRFLTDARTVVEGLDVEVVEPWIRHVFVPMMEAHEAWRIRDREGYDNNVQQIACPVWRQACAQWWPA